MGADSYLTARDRVAGQYGFTIRKKDKTLLSALTTLRLSLYIKGTAGPTYINGRQDQDVLGGGSGANNVTFGLAEDGVTASPGRVVWNIQPADNALAGDADETHVALFSWTAPGEDDFHEVEIAVPNTRVRPAV